MKKNPQYPAARPCFFLPDAKGKLTKKARSVAVVRYTKNHHTFIPHIKANLSFAFFVFIGGSYRKRIVTLYL